MRKEFTVCQLAKAFGVSRSGYYEYLKRPQRTLTERDLKDKQLIQLFYNETGGTYGAKRITGTLKENKNYVINHKRVARLMKEMNIQSKVRIKKTTRERKKLLVAIFIQIF